MRKPEGGGAERYAHKAREDDGFAPNFVREGGPEVDLFGASRGFSWVTGRYVVEAKNAETAEHDDEK